jgi:hypothetical protein
MLTMSNLRLYEEKKLPTGAEEQSIMKWSEELSKCRHYQKLGTGGIVAILLTARELDLPPMGCLNGGLYHIDGKVTLSSQFMNMLILKAGHSADINELNNERCVIHFKRKDSDKIIPYEYTISDAQKAGLVDKDNWRKNPKDMLFSRCLSSGARKILPDAFMSPCYLHGDIEENKNEDSKEEDCILIEEDCILIEEENNYNEIEEEFTNKFDLNNNESLASKYINLISKESGKARNEVIKMASENQERFEEAFSRWQSSYN